jgi:putative transposase
VASSMTTIAKPRETNHVRFFGQYAIEELVLKFARENRSWGHRRIVGAISNVGHEVSHQTVANILERHGLLPAPDRERKTSWREFIRSHTEVLAAVDFFTAEVWTTAGLIT